MTTYRTYRCNLCRDYIKPTEDSPREGFGVHFFGGVPSARNPWLTFNRSCECEHHICTACAVAVSEELSKGKPA